MLKKILRFIAILMVVELLVLLGMCFLYWGVPDDMWLVRWLVVAIGLPTTILITMIKG